MPDEGNKLKLGKGSAFGKRDLRQLPQAEDVWEADFLSLPRKGRSQEWLGIVVSHRSMFPIATRFCQMIPTVNDLASLLSNAMRRPLIEAEKRQRPARIYLRDDPRWAELIPYLEQLGIEVATAERLTLCENEAADLIGRVDEGSPAKCRRPAGEPDVEALYPNVAKWVNGYGWIEIGMYGQEGLRARALDEGGLIYENTDCDSLAEAMWGLENGLGEWFEEQDSRTMTTPAFPLRLTAAQRKVTAEILPVLAPRLRLDMANQQTLQFTLAEMKEIAEVADAAVWEVKGGMKRNSLRCVVDTAKRAVERFAEGGIARIPASERIYQFKITLQGIELPTWRRIQVKDCTLDKLHERIQTAMGWTNSHLHQFIIGDVIYGNPKLLYEGWEDEEPPVNSLRVRISQIVPADGKRFMFDYEYDFGDNWEHKILFEGCVRAETGMRYPLCVEGERACPPEDVGGIYGYQDYLEALTDPKHEEHESYLQWRGPFDSEAFSAEKITKAMRRGLPNWQDEY